MRSRSWGLIPSLGFYVGLLVIPLAYLFFSGLTLEVSFPWWKDPFLSHVVGFTVGRAQHLSALLSGAVPGLRALYSTVSCSFRDGGSCGTSLSSLSLCLPS